MENLLLLDRRLLLPVAGNWRVRREWKRVGAWRRRVVSVFGFVKLRSAWFTLDKLNLLLRMMVVMIMLVVMMHVRLLVLWRSVLDARSSLGYLWRNLFGHARGPRSDVVLLLLSVERGVGTVAVWIPGRVHRRVDVWWARRRVQLRNVKVMQRRAVERTVRAGYRKVVVVVDIAVSVIILIIIVLLILLMQQINIGMRVLRIRLRRKLLEVVLWKWLTLHGGRRDLIEVRIEHIAALAKRYGTIRWHWCSLAGRRCWDSKRGGNSIKRTNNQIIGETYMAQTFCPAWFPPSASYSPTLISDCMLQRFEIRLSALAMAVMLANFFTIL